MKYKVVVNRNSISMTVEEMVIEANSEQEAKTKAKEGKCIDVDITECSDVAELSSEVVSIEKISE